MRNVAATLVVTAFVIFGIADTACDFVANDTARFYLEQPQQLLLVVAVGNFGGLAVLGFHRLSARWQRRVGLLSLSSAAGFAMLGLGWLWLHVSDFWPMACRELVSALLSLGALALLLGAEFFHLLRRRVL